MSYDIIRNDIPETDKFLELQQYKAKLVQLHATRTENLMLDTSVHDRMEGEEPSLFHLLETFRRRNTRAIQLVQEQHGIMATLPQDVAIVFLNYLRQKFEPIDIDRDILPSMLANIQLIDTTSAESLEQPVTLEEVMAAIRSGAKHKTPGINGICLEFFLQTGRRCTKTSSSYLTKCF
jgi:hypothetical protein